MTTWKIGRSIATACLVLFLVVTLAWGGVQPTPFRTGLFGVTAGQTVRVSVLNAGDERGIINPCWKIWDASGKLLLESEGQPLAHGTGTFVDFAIPAPNDSASLGTPVPNDGRSRKWMRTQVRAEVELEPAPHDGQPVPDDGQPVPEGGKGRARVRPDDVIVTLEVFDSATGRTAFTMPFYPPDPVRRGR